MKDLLCPYCGEIMTVCTSRTSPSPDSGHTQRFGCWDGCGSGGPGIQIDSGGHVGMATLSETYLKTLKRFTPKPDIGGSSSWRG